MQDMWVQSLGGEDPLKKEMATSFSIFAWKISWTVEPHGVYIVWGCKRVGHDLVTAAAAKSLQSCLTLCDPIDGSPPGSPIPGILQARTLE